MGPALPVGDDILSQLIQADFIKAVLRDARSAGIDVRVEGRSVPAALPGWADGLVAFTPVGSACDVAPALQKLVRIIDFQSRNSGVLLSYNTGKSEALCVFRGPGSQSVKRELLSVEPNWKLGL